MKSLNRITAAAAALALLAAPVAFADVGNSRDDTRSSDHESHCAPTHAHDREAHRATMNEKAVQERGKKEAAEPSTPEYPIFTDQG